MTLQGPNSRLRSDTVASEQVSPPFVASKLKGVMGAVCLTAAATCTPDVSQVEVIHNKQVVDNENAVGIYADLQDPTQNRVNTGLCIYVNGAHVATEWFFDEVVNVDTARFLVPFVNSPNVHARRLKPDGTCGFNLGDLSYRSID